MEESILAQKISELSVQEIESLLLKLSSSDRDAFEALKEVVLDEIF